MEAVNKEGYWRGVCLNEGEGGLLYMWQFIHVHSLTLIPLIGFVKLMKVRRAGFECLTVVKNSRMSSALWHCVVWYGLPTFQSDELSLS